MVFHTLTRFDVIKDFLYQKSYCICYKEQLFNLIIPGDPSSFATFSKLYTLLEDAQAMHASSSSIKSGYCVH